MNRDDSVHLREPIYCRVCSVRPQQHHDGSQPGPNSCQRPLTSFAAPTRYIPQDNGQSDTEKATRHSSLYTPPDRHPTQVDLVIPNHVSQRSTRLAAPRQSVRTPLRCPLKCQRCGAASHELDRPSLDEPRRSQHAHHRELAQTTSAIMPTRRHHPIQAASPLFTTSSPHPSPRPRRNKAGERPTMRTIVSVAS